jgi:hypothetical protein
MAYFKPLSQLLSRMRIVISCYPCGMCHSGRGVAWGSALDQGRTSLAFSEFQNRAGFRLSSLSEALSEQFSEFQSFFQGKSLGEFGNRSGCWAPELRRISRLAARATSPGTFPSRRTFSLRIFCFNLRELVLGPCGHGSESSNCLNLGCPNDRRKSRPKEGVQLASDDDRRELQA